MEKRQKLKKPFILNRFSIYFLILLVSEMFPAIHVSGDAMQPTLEGNHVYMTTKIEVTERNLRGVIVNVKNDKGEYIAQRVIGLPGDKVILTKNRVVINDKVLDEPYLPEELQEKIKNNEEIYNEDERGRFIIPKGEYFLLGDNRLSSKDSRHEGTYNKKEFKTKIIKKVS